MAEANDEDELAWLDKVKTFFSAKIKRGYLYTNLKY